MNTSHTTGPWEWWDAGVPVLATPDRGKLIVMAGEDGARLAFAERSDNLGGILHTLTIDELRQHPDARLIAAAPDLYEACDPDTLDAIADEIDCHEHSARSHSLRIMAKKQRAALRKAENGGE